MDNAVIKCLGKDEELDGLLEVRAEDVNEGNVERWANLAISKTTMMWDSPL